MEFCEHYLWMTWDGHAAIMENPVTAPLFEAAEAFVNAIVGVGCEDDLDDIVDALRARNGERYAALAEYPDELTVLGAVNSPGVLVWRYYETDGMLSDSGWSVYTRGTAAKWVEGETRGLASALTTVRMTYGMVH